MINRILQLHNEHIRLMHENDVEIYPATEFLKKLWNHEIV